MIISKSNWGCVKSNSKCIEELYNLMKQSKLWQDLDAKDLGGWAMIQVMCEKKIVYFQICSPSRKPNIVGKSYVRRFFVVIKYSPASYKTQQMYVKAVGEDAYKLGLVTDPHKTNAAYEIAVEKIPVIKICS